MYSGFLCSALASVAFLLLAVPASNAAESLPLSPGPGVSAARALVGAGRFVEALTDLRPLLQAHPGRTDILFLTGLAAIEAAQKPDTPESDRQALLGEAIASLRTILTNRPGLVRVRLELARAFFLKGEDSLARGHFERVLAGKPPAPVVANVQRFLAEIRARRRWTMYLGAAMSPDSNIGGASDEQISRWLRLGASVALPLGFSVGGSGELRWTDYEGNWVPFTRNDASREDRTRILRATVHNRGFTLFGFSPQLVVTNEARDTNAHLYDYKRTRAELRAVRQF